MNIGSILATFALCRLLKEKSGKYPNSKKNRNRAVCGKCEKSKLRQFVQFFKGGILSRIKAYSALKQRSPKHTDRQCRSGIFKGVTFFGLCYRLYSKLPDFAVLMRFSLNSRSVTERKGEKWTTTQKG